MELCRFLHLSGPHAGGRKPEGPFHPGPQTQDGGALAAGEMEKDGVTTIPGQVGSNATGGEHATAIAGEGRNPSVKDSFSVAK